MARPLRYIPPGSLVEVTTRTIQARYLCRPSPEVNDIILGIFGRAQVLFAVRVHAFVVLSNHWHGLFSVDNAAQLASFVAFINGNIARELGRLHDWRQRFWGRRYRAIVVDDDDAAVARLRYIFQNGCQERLVDRPADWPGVSCVRNLTAGEELVGTWHDRTAEFHARKRGQRIIPGQFARRYRVEVTPLPCWSGRSPARNRAACAEMIESVEAETRTERTLSRKPCLGREAILAQDPHDGPDDPDTSPAPFVHASTTEGRVRFCKAYAAFVDAFRAAAARLRRGESSEFPLGAFPPPGPFAAGPATAA